MSQEQNRSDQCFMGNTCFAYISRSLTESSGSCPFRRGTSRKLSFQSVCNFA